MAGNPKVSKWFSTPTKKRKAKPSIFTLSDDEQEALDALAHEHKAPRSRIVGAAILLLRASPKAEEAIEASCERVTRGG